MAAWSGFTDEDLRKVKNISTSDNRQSKHNEQMKKASLGNKSSSNRRPQPTATSSSAKIDPSMKLHPADSNDTSQNFSSHMIPKESFRETDVKGSGETADSSENVISSSSGNSDPGVREPEPPDELGQEEALSRDILSLDKFRVQQKAMEEANKQKKALLSKTLSERRKKAQAEAHKLEHIQRELAKLDHLLTADVQVVRYKIEDASLDFLHAQKRYEKAEAEYVEAKMDLHVKQELKEHLTQHLYTIIHQNELRKAKKLARLMKELDMESGDEDFQLLELPPWTSFQPTIAGPMSPTRVTGDAVDKHKGTTGEVNVNVSVNKDEQETQTVGEATTVTGESGGITVGKESVAGTDSDGKVTAGDCDNSNTPDVKPDVDTGLSLKSECLNIKCEDQVSEQCNTTSVNESLHRHTSNEADTADRPSAVKSPSNPVPSTEQTNRLPSPAGHIKVGQTSKMVSELKANISRELETVEQLERNVLTSGSAETVAPTSWEFDGTVK